MMKVIALILVFILKCGTAYADEIDRYSIVMDCSESMMAKWDLAKNAANNVLMFAPETNPKSRFFTFSCNGGVNINNPSDKKKTVMLLVTDGLNEEILKIASEYYQNNSHSEIHIISLSSSDEGDKIISKIAEMNKFTLVVSASSLLDEETVKEFSDYVFRR